MQSTRLITEEMVVQVHQALLGQEASQLSKRSVKPWGENPRWCKSTLAHHESVERFKVKVSKTFNPGSNPGRLAIHALLV